MVGSESARLTTNRRSDFMKASAPLDLSKLGSANDQGLRRKGGEKSQVKQLELCGASSSILTTMSKSCLHSKSVHTLGLLPIACSPTGDFRSCSGPQVRFEEEQRSNAS